MSLRIPISSKEYVRIPVVAKEAGAQVNPTADVVKVAFMAAGSPGPTDFQPATWETDTTVTPTRYFARSLVGGTGTGATVELPIGSYAMFVKVTDSPEVPVREVGVLEVY